MSEKRSGQNILDWITLVLAIVFLLMGLCMITGFFIPEKLALAVRTRVIMGLVLVIYGTVRAVMISKRMRWGKRG